MRPDLGDIEGIVLELLGLVEGHHLDVHRPAGELAGLDPVVQVPDAIVGIAAGQLIGGLHVQILDALIGLQMEFGVDRFTLGIDQLEGMGSVSIHVGVAIGSAAIAEQEAHLVRGLGTQGEEVPEHVRILQMRLRIPLLGVNEAGEQDGITNEEDGGVVANQIPDTVLRVELDGESARITSGIGRSALTAHRGESHGQGGALLDLVEHLGSTVLADVVGHLEVAEGAGTLGVDNALRDALAIEVRHLVKEVNILQQDRTPGTHRLCGILDANGRSMSGGNNSRRNLKN